MRIRLAAHTPTAGVPPPPLVLLLGWFRASHRPLGKYAAVHSAAGCHTAAVIAPPGVVFALFPGPQFAFAVAVAAAVAAATGPDGVPLLAGGVVLHPFSNGGAFVVRRLVELAALPPVDRSAAVAAAIAASRSATAAGDAAAVATAAVDALAAATAGTLFDSCPVALSHASALTATTHAAGIGAGTAGGAGIGAAVGRAVTAASLGGWIGLQFVLCGNVPAAFWATMRDGEAPGGPAAGVAYAYSAADATADTPALEELIAARRARGGDVRAWRVEDAPHVALLVGHRQDYEAFVGGCVADWIAAWRKRQPGGGGGGEAAPLVGSE